MDLLPLLQTLKGIFDNLPVAEQRPDLRELYKSDILPHLLQLRKSNRSEKHNLEIKHEKIKNLNHQLSSLQQSNDNLQFEAACLGTPTKDVELADEEVRKLDHISRMRYLDEEEERRKDLQRKLTQLNNEMKDLEKLYLQSADEFKEVKPYVKQLLDITKARICFS